MNLETLLNSNAASALIGAASGVAGFLASEWMQRWRRKNERREKYVAGISAALAEISFYAQKLKQISSDTTFIAEHSNEFSGVNLVPSYKVYPEHIEKLKIEICGETKNRELAVMLVQCHYDLSHVAEKMASLVQMGSKSGDFISLNAKQLARVADSTVKHFELTATILETEIEKFS
jgi:hypothetical protein